jgi:hypothetical protein
VTEELLQFLDLAEKEDLQRDDNNAAGELDEGWIAAAERAGLGINIWKEPADCSDNLVIDSKTGKVSAATLNKLVMRMTATTSSEDYGTSAIMQQLQRRSPRPLTRTCCLSSGSCVRA